MPPLQDNVQLVLEWVQQRWPWVEVLWRWEWIGIKHKLVAVVMLALSVLFNQVVRLNVWAVTLHIHMPIWHGRPAYPSPSSFPAS